MLTPGVVLVAGLLLYPILRTIWLSFHDVGLAELTTGNGPWVGTDNYRRLFSDGFFWTVMRNTVGLAAACVVLTMVLGTLVALLLQRLPRPVRVLVSIVVPCISASAFVSARKMASARSFTGCGASHFSRIARMCFRCLPCGCGLPP